MSKAKKLELNRATVQKLNDNLDQVGGGVMRPDASGSTSNDSTGTCTTYVVMSCCSWVGCSW